jgi:hypothetical protein
MIHSPEVEHAAGTGVIEHEDNLHVFSCSLDMKSKYADALAGLLTLGTMCGRY